MSRWLRDHGNTLEEVDSYKDPLTKLYINSLKDLTWDYIKLVIEDKLEEKQDFLIS
jgi:hypothetical protein